jgi:hypothetical protein
MRTQLGMKYKDRITTFVGIATGRVEYLTGCNQVLLSPAVGDDGKLRDAHWFDEQRLEQVGTDVIELDNSNAPGCDIPAPKY